MKASDFWLACGCLALFNILALSPSAGLVPVNGSRAALLTAASVGWGVHQTKVVLMNALLNQSSHGLSANVMNPAALAGMDGCTHVEGPQHLPAIGCSRTCASGEFLRAVCGI